MLYVLGSLPCQKRKISVVVDFNGFDAAEDIILIEDGNIIKEFSFDHTMVQGPLLEVLAQKYVFQTIYGGDYVKGPSDFDPVLFFTGLKDVLTQR